MIQEKSGISRSLLLLSLFTSFDTIVFRQVLCPGTVHLAAGFANLPVFLTCARLE